MKARTTVCPHCFNRVTLGKEDSPELVDVPETTICERCNKTYSDKESYDVMVKLNASVAQLNQSEMAQAMTREGVGVVERTMCAIVGIVHTSFAKDPAHSITNGDVKRAVQKFLDGAEEHNVTHKDLLAKMLFELTVVDIGQQYQSSTAALGAVRQLEALGIGKEVIADVVKEALGDRLPPNLKDAGESSSLTA